MPETIRLSTSGRVSNVRLPAELQALVQSPWLRSWVKRQAEEISRSKGFGRGPQVRLEDAIRQKFLVYQATPATADAVICILKALVLKEHLNSVLNSVGDDVQLANAEMQDELQKQEQTLQLLSTISKLLFDTALSVIRKVGG